MQASGLSPINGLRACQYVADSSIYCYRYHRRADSTRGAYAMQPRIGRRRKMFPRNSVGPEYPSCRAPRLYVEILTPFICSQADRVTSISVSKVLLLP